MKRSRSRQSAGTAVLWFFIGLLLVILIVGLGVFLLNLDRDSGYRPYVATGNGTPKPTLEPTPEPSPVLPDVPENPETPEYVPTVEVEITPEPTQTPEPTPSPEPTPVPTQIPRSELSVIRDKFSLPNPTQDGSVGISGCYVSAVDGYSIMELTGWGYANLDYFDGATCGVYLVITSLQDSSRIAVLAANRDGISGVPHPDAICQNASASDWRAYIDVTGWPAGVYQVSIALAYKNGSKPEYRYYTLTDLQSFTVNDGEVIIPVTPSDIP